MERAITNDAAGSASTEPRARSLPWPALRDAARRAAAWADRYAAALALVGSLLVVLARYGQATGFAFLFDDTADLARVEDNSYWTLIASAPDYAYYRPLAYVIWKLLRDIVGYHSEAVLHTLPLLLHAIVGWLLYLLVRRLGAGHWALGPAVLFLLTPFHYQVVPLVCTTYYPLATAGMLGSMMLYLSAREISGARARSFHLAAVGATCVALWGHESGVAVLPLLVALEGWLLLRGGSRRPSVWLAAHLSATLLFLLTWFTVDKLPFTERTSLDEVHPKSMFFLQAFAFPVSAQRQLAADEAGVSLGLLEVVLPALLFVCGAYGLAAWRSGRRWLAAVPGIGLLIAVIGAVPSVARLPWSYVENGPRLLYLSSIGAALVWGLLPALHFGNRRVDIAWRAVTLVLLALVVAQSWRFVDVRMRMYEQASELVNGVVAQGERYRGQQLVYYNVPAWFAQGRYEYQYGHFGIQVMPSYIGLDRIIAISSDRGTTALAGSVAWQPDVSGEPFTFGPHGTEVDTQRLDVLLREGHEVIVVRRAGDGFRVRNVGRMRSGPPDELASAVGRLGDSVSLAPARAALLDDELIIYLQWNVIAPFGIDAETIVELRDGDGTVVARYQGYALAGFAPPRFWQAGDQIDDSVAFPAPPAGRYGVYVGLQHAGSDERLVARAVDGDEPADRLLPAGEIEIAPAIPAGSGSSRPRAANHR